MNVYSSKKNHNPLGTGHKNKEPLPDKYGKGGKGYTCSTGNKKHARCEDLHNSRDNQTHHEILSPPCQGHSSLDAPSELNLPQRIPSPLLSHY